MHVRIHLMEISQIEKCPNLNQFRKKILLRKQENLPDHKPNGPRLKVWTLKKTILGQEGLGDPYGARAEQPARVL